MNILNNLWLAISTPNEELVKIVCVFLLFIEAPLSFSLINNVFNLSCTKKQKYLYISVTACIAAIATLFISWPFNIILNYITAFLILYFVIKLSFIKSFIATIFPSIVFNLIGYLLANPYLDLLKITYEENNTIAIYRIPFALLTYSIVLIFNLIIKYRKFTINILEDFDKKSKSIIIFNFIFGFICIFLQGILSVKYIDILPIEFTFFNFICLLIYFVLSFFSLAKVMSLSTTTKKLESAEEYNKTLHILHDNVRGFKHDFDNIVTTIGGYIKTNDMEGLKKYYS